MELSMDINKAVFILIEGLGLFIMGIAFHYGYGKWLIDGYNEMAEEEKRKFDAKELTGFIGKFTIFVALLMWGTLVANIFSLSWYNWFFAITLLLGTIFVLFYIRNSKKFKKDVNPSQKPS